MFVFCIPLNSARVPPVVRVPQFENQCFISWLSAAKDLDPNHSHLPLEVEVVVQKLSDLLIRVSLRKEHIPVSHGPPTPKSHDTIIPSNQQTP